MIGWKAIEIFKNDPQVSNPGGTWETNGAPDEKMVFVFYGEK